MSDRSQIDESNIAWADDNDFNSNEKCLVATIEGKWYDVKCTEKNFPLCQRPVKWTMANSKLYTIEDAGLNKKTFSDAKALCSSMGEHVTLYEPRDLDTIEAVGRAQLKTSVWVNAEQAGATGTTFQFSDGTTVPSSLFNDDEPNSTNEQCAEANKGAKLNDITCSETRNVVCQKEIVTENNPDCTDTSSHGKILH